MRNTTTRLLSAAAVICLALAACGSDDTSDLVDPTAVADAPSSTATPPITAEPSTSEATTSEATTSEATGASLPGGVAERIVSLSPTHTEILFAIGAGDQLVAVDEFSDHPAAALGLPHELSGYEPNVEAIAAYEPDLVVIGGDFTGLGEQLASVGIESWDGPAAATLDDTYAQIEQLGAITGHVGDAAELVSSMQTDIDEIIAGVPAMDEPLTYYHELDPELYSVDSTTFLGEIYGLLGLRNIADRVEGDHGGYPQLNAEFIVGADPDLIFLADTVCCGQSLATVSARPGWASMRAVVEGNVIEMDDDIASRWGPRAVEYLAAVAAAVDTALAPA